MHKLNIGDKVRVRPDLKKYITSKFDASTIHDGHYTNDGYTFNHNMFNYAGKIITVGDNCHADKIISKEGRWSWRSDLLTPHNPDPLHNPTKIQISWQEFRVSDFNKKTKKLFNQFIEALNNEFTE